MLDTLDADALGLVLAHLGADDLAHVAAACASLRRKVLAAEHLWSQLLGGPQLFADVAVRAPPRLPSAAAATPNSPPRTAAEALVVRVLAVRAAALANWRSASPSVSEYVLEPTGERAGMVSALALDDCTLAAGGSDHCVRVWCLQTRALQLTLRGHSGAVRCLLLRAARHELFSGAWDKTVRQWDLRTGTCVREFARVHERCVMALAFASKHVLVSAGGEGRVAWTDLRATPEWTQPPPQRRFARTRRYESPVLALEVIKLE
ncbi:WD40-repeat-containing domain protein [Pavlovales sp. CCMP2436]|nr:WD40-repeat-containing domain protein [Pavlovales sp. CCMP2436]